MYCKYIGFSYSAYFHAINNTSSFFYLITFIVRTICIKLDGLLLFEKGTTDSNIMPIVKEEYEEANTNSCALNESMEIDQMSSTDALSIESTIKIENDFVEESNIEINNKNNTSLVSDLNNLHDNALHSTPSNHSESSHSSIPSDLETMAPNKSSIFSKDSNIMGFITSPEEEYFNHCLYSCYICNAQFQSDKRFRFHLATAHSMNYDKYLQSHPNPADSSPLLALNLYTCLICHEILTHDSTQVKQHLREKHQKSLNDYCSQYNIS